MGREKKKVDSFYKRNNYDTNKFWKPGQPLDEKDEEMLQEVKAIYQMQGYVPTKEEVSNTSDLKARFRTWKNVMIAAGLPELNDPIQTQKRMAAKEQNKQEGTV